MYFGVDYYPEHWPKNRWKQDAEMMHRASINVVRLAEFAWSTIERDLGQFDFSWLDEAIEVLASHGISIIIGTPTATPPKWLMDDKSDMYQVDIYNRKRGFGSRIHYCRNHPAYQEHTKRIVKSIAEHYRHNQHVVAFQIDNEFGCHNTTRCYCSHCHNGYILWLKKKYMTIENLNSAWGTVFWSQTYRNWDEIILPWFTSAASDVNDNPSRHNPSMMMDFYRYSSDTVVAYQRMQIDEIRKAGCCQPISHNLMGLFDQINYYNLGKDLDFISWDNYPNAGWRKSHYLDVSMAHDLMRGVKGKNFWVMEQQSGPLGWNHLGNTPRPGQLRLWTYQAIAHGAEAILYFRWRACTYGAEELCYGVIDHDGLPRRRYDEIAKTGKEMMKISDIVIGSEIVAETAIIQSYDNLWSFQIQSHHPEFDYHGLLKSYYHALSANRCNTDIISVTCDYSKYKLLVMPAFSLVSDQIEKGIREYVENGGSLVLTFRSGTRTLNNTMDTKTLPGCFRLLSGVIIDEFDCLYRSDNVQIEGVMGQAIASVWCDVLRAESAEVIAVYKSEYYKGKPAITKNKFGKGYVYYIGCDLDQASLNSLLKIITDDLEITKSIFTTPNGIETVQKVSNGKTHFYLLNHNAYQTYAQFEGVFRDIISGKRYENGIMLEPFGIAVMTE